MESDACGCAPASAPQSEPLPGALKRTRPSVSHPSLVLQRQRTEGGESDSNEFQKQETEVPAASLLDPDFTRSSWEPAAPTFEGHSTPQTILRTCVVKCREGTFVVIPRSTVHNPTIYSCILDAVAKAEAAALEEDPKGLKLTALYEIERAWRDLYAA